MLNRIKMALCGLVFLLIYFGICCQCALCGVYAHDKIEVAAVCAMYGTLLPIVSVASYTMFKLAIFGEKAD